MTSKVHYDKPSDSQAILNKNISILWLKAIYKQQNVCLTATFCPNYPHSYLP